MEEGPAGAVWGGRGSHKDARSDEGAGAAPGLGSPAASPLRARLRAHPRLLSSGPLHPGDNIRANGTSQKGTRQGMPPNSGVVHFWEVPVARMSSPGWAH